MAERRSRGPITAYRLAGSALSPLLPLLLSWRGSRGKEVPSRIGERYGEPTMPRPEGRLVWVHAASVGETNAVMPLAAWIAATGTAILFTTATVTGSEVAEAKLPKGAIHQFVPLDVDRWVERFLAHWRPDLALFVESELWPATIGRLSERGVPLAIVNGRLSERSFRRWQRYGGIARSLFEPIALGLVQSEGDAERFRGLGVREVVVTGNLKFDVPAPAADPAGLAALLGAVGRRPVWVAASTHDGEESAVADVHRDLSARYPTLLTIIVPRHPKRGVELKTKLERLGFTVKLRSEEGQPAADTDLYLADTLGELGLFYRLAHIAFLGGSLIPHGGQNPIEAAQLNTAILHGPHVGNFAEIFAALDEAGGAETVTDAASLAAKLDRLLADRALATAMAGRGRAALAPFAGALGRSFAALKHYLEGATA